MNPLADLLLASARTAPYREWVRAPGARPWTYGDLDEASAALAHVLVGRGVRPGERVVVQTPGSTELLALHVACVRAGGVWVPLNTAYTPTEVGALVAEADPVLVVTDQPQGALGASWSTLAQLWAESAERSHAFDDAECSPDDPASMLFTSGTTGRPKGAVLSHENLVTNARTLVSAWGFTPDDVLLHVLPLFHTHGLFVGVHSATAAGASLVLLPRFDVTEVVRELRASTVLMGVPTHYTRLLAEPTFTREVASGVRLFTSGSAPMLVSTHEEFRVRTGQTVLERYGMTETCMLTSNPLLGDRRTGTVGPALPGVEVRIAGPEPGAEPGDAERIGDVEVRGPNVFGGYWRRPDADAEAFTTDGWFRTGDLGHLDRDGYLTLVGRSKDLIISGGLNVHPQEVEEVLNALPGVVESAVVGIPDTDLGEIVVAVVVPVPGAELDPALVRAACRDRLAGFKVPKRVVLREVLPRNAMGKVEKARLRAELAADLPN